MSQSKTSELFITKKSFTLLEYNIIYAILNGYFHDKDITNYLSIHRKVNYHSVQYNMRKILCKFDANSRGELFRKLIAADFAQTIINPNIEKIFQR